jgi:hypothetical protein
MRSLKIIDQTTDHFIITVVDEPTTIEVSLLEDGRVIAYVYDASDTEESLFAYDGTYDQNRSLVNQSGINYHWYTLHFGTYSDHDALDSFLAGSDVARTLGPNVQVLVDGDSFLNWGEDRDEDEHIEHGQVVFTAQSPELAFTLGARIFLALIEGDHATLTATASRAEHVPFAVTDRDDWSHSIDTTSR